MAHFVGVVNEFTEALKQYDKYESEDFLAENQCEFVFNAPLESHTGGVCKKIVK